MIAFLLFASNKDRVSGETHTLKPGLPGLRLATPLMFPWFGLKNYTQLTINVNKQRHEI